MKRIHVLALALLALFAVSMVAVAAASAVEFLLALWLESGVNVTATLLVESEGELELAASGVKVLCSGILDGWVGPNSLDFVSELLRLDGVTVVSLTALTTPELVCTNVAGCETVPHVWAVNLPWETEVELMVDGTETFFVDLISSSGAGNPGWAVLCRVLGVEVENVCTAEAAAVKETNLANGTVENMFEDAFQTLAGLKLANCTVTGAETGEVKGPGITLESGVTLSISSE